MDRLEVFEVLANEFDLLQVRESKALYDRAVVIARDVMLSKGYVRNGQAHFYQTHVNAEMLVRDWLGMEFPPETPHQPHTE